MNLFEEVGIIKELIKEENKKQNKILGDIASSMQIGEDTELQQRF